MRAGPPELQKRRATDALRQGFPLPRDLANAPRLAEGLELFLEAYRECTYERPVNGFCVVPLPPSVFRTYARMHGFDAEQEEMLVRYGLEMDAAARDYWEQSGDKQRPRAVRAKDDGGVVPRRIKRGRRR